MTTPLSNMEDFEKLRRRGLLEALPNGEGVRVSLQYLPSLPPGSRVDRRNYLTKMFRNVAAKLTPVGVLLEINSLSISGQNVEAIVPIDRYQVVESELHRDNIRMNVTVEHDAQLRIS